MAETILAAILVGVAEAITQIPKSVPLPVNDPPRKPPRRDDLLPVDARLQAAIELRRDVPPPVEPEAKPKPKPPGPKLPPPTDVADGVERIRFPVVEDAIEVIQASRLFSGDDFQQTAEAVREGAFAVTGEFTDKMLADIRALLADHMAKGLDREAFVDEAVKLLGTSRHHAEQIYRNNIGQALGQGAERALRHPVVIDAFPYRKYRATADDRVRKTHLALESFGLNGTAVYNKDDPVWITFAPPWEWNCRCAMSPLTVAKAAQLGVQEAIDWLDRAKAIADERGGRAAQYLTSTAPDEFAFVAWPAIDGKRIMPPPEWDRGGILSR